MNLHWPTKTPLSLYLVVIVIFIAGFPGWATGGPSAEVIGLPMGPGLRMDPYFVEDQPTSKNITVLAGQKAYLECRVRNLGAKRVSWVRHRDVQILSVDGNVFTTDKRFNSLQSNQDDGRFTLMISRVRPSDEGIYECQISTKPTKSLFINLLIIIPSISILSDSAKHVEHQSALNLTCVMNAVPSDGGQMWPKMVWYKDGKVIDNYVGGRGIISEKEANGSTVSNIYVGAATIQDTGNYTCEAPALATNASVNLHVLVDGESPNAWKSNTATTLFSQLNLNLSPFLKLHHLTITSLFLLRNLHHHRRPL